MGDIFKVFDYILKKRPILPQEEDYPSPFMLNRWISMSDSSICNIINSTTNRWITQKGICSNNSIQMTNFFRNILPRINKKIFYIKKPKQKEESTENIEFSNPMEISSRELKIYEDMVAFLKNTSK